MSVCEDFFDLKFKIKELLNSENIKSCNIIDLFIKKSCVPSNITFNPIIINENLISWISKELFKIIPNNELNFIPMNYIYENIKIILDYYFNKKKELFEVIKILKLKLINELDINDKEYKNYIFNIEKIIITIKIYTNITKLKIIWIKIKKFCENFFYIDDEIFQDIENTELFISKINWIYLLDDITYKYFLKFNNIPISNYIDLLKKYSLYEFYEKNYNFNLEKSFVSKYKNFYKNFIFYHNLEEYLNKIKNDSLDSIKYDNKFKICLNGYEIKNNLEFLNNKYKQIFVEDLENIKENCFISISNDIFYNNQFKSIINKFFLDIKIQTNPNYWNDFDFNVYHELYFTKRIYDLNFKNINFNLLKKIIKSYDNNLINFNFNFNNNKNIIVYFKEILDNHFNFDTQNNEVILNIRNKIVNILIIKLKMYFLKELLFEKSKYFKVYRLYKYLKKIKRIFNSFPLKYYNNSKGMTKQNFDNKNNINYLLILIIDNNILIFINKNFKNIDFMNLKINSQTNYKFKLENDHKNKIKELIKKYNIKLVVFNGNSLLFKLLFDQIKILISEIITKDEIYLITLFKINKILDNLYNNYENILIVDKNYNIMKKIILYTIFINNPLLLSYYIFINNDKIQFGKYKFDKKYFNELCKFLLMNNYFNENDFKLLFPFISINISENFYLKKDDNNLTKNNEFKYIGDIIFDEKEIIYEYKNLILPKLNLENMFIIYNIIKKHFKGVTFDYNDLNNEIDIINTNKNINLSKNLFILKNYLKWKFNLKLLTKESLFLINNDLISKNIFNSKIIKNSFVLMKIIKFKYNYIIGEINNLFRGKLFYKNININNNLIINVKNVSNYFLLYDEIKVYIKGYEKNNILKLLVTYKNNDINIYINYLRKNSILRKYNLELNKNFIFNINEDCENDLKKNIKYDKFYNCNKEESYFKLIDKNIGDFLLRPTKNVNVFILNIKISEKYFQMLQIIQNNFSGKIDNYNNIKFRKLIFKNINTFELNYINPIVKLIKKVNIYPNYVDNPLNVYNKDYVLIKNNFDLVWYDNKIDLKLLLIYYNNNKIITKEIILVKPNGFIFHKIIFKNLKKLISYWKINRNKLDYLNFLDQNKKLNLYFNNKNTIINKKNLNKINIYSQLKVSNNKNNFDSEKKKFNKKNNIANNINNSFILNKNKIIRKPSFKNIIGNDNINLNKREVFKNN